MAETTFAWLSVTVKRGAVIVVPRKIVKIEWDKVFGELLATVDPDLENSAVHRVCISKNANFIDPVHDVEVSAPLSVCSLFDCLFVCFYLQEQTCPVPTPGKLCVDPVETQYYSATLVSFPLVCYYCGIDEESLVEDDEIERLRSEFAVVRPLCFLCKSDGKTPFVKMPRNSKNSRKRPRQE